MSNQYRKYFITAGSVLSVILFIWLFTRVVIFVLISIILAFLAQPLVRLFSKIKFGNKELPGSIIALLSLVSIFGFFFLLIYLFVPVLVNEVKFLSMLNFNDVFSEILSQFPRIKNALLNFGTEKEISANLIGQFQKLLNVHNISSLLETILSLAGSFAGGFLAVSFITFFLLKDDKLVVRTALLLTPSIYEAEIKDILRNTKRMLTQYFVGLFADIFVVSTLVSLLMFFFGVKNALFIGIFTGLMNIIPYIGPVISLVFAITLGVTGCIEIHQIDQIREVITKIFFILLSVNILDGLLFQPFIYSNSVRAHPLEIFIVILMAATLAGVWGMVVAIPTYTLLRIIAKEFLVNYKFFRKMTDSIPDEDTGPLLKFPKKNKDDEHPPA